MHATLEKPHITSRERVGVLDVDRVYVCVRCLRLQAAGSSERCAWRQGRQPDGLMLRKGREKKRGVRVAGLSHAARCVDEGAPGIWDPVIGWRAQREQSCDHPGSTRLSRGYRGKGVEGGALPCHGQVRPGQARSLLAPASRLCAVGWPRPLLPPGIQPGIDPAWSLLALPASQPSQHPLAPPRSSILLSLLLASTIDEQHGPSKNGSQGEHHHPAQPAQHRYPSRRPVRAPAIRQVPARRRDFDFGLSIVDPRPGLHLSTDLPGSLWTLRCPPSTIAFSLVQRPSSARTLHAAHARSVDPIRLSPTDHRRPCTAVNSSPGTLHASDFGISRTASLPTAHHATPDTRLLQKGTFDTFFPSHVVCLA